jgi:hypothetical protein
MIDDIPADGRAPIEATPSASAAGSPTPTAVRPAAVEPPPRWQTGPERVRSVVEAEALRRAKRRRLTGDDRGWDLETDDEDDASTSQAEEQLRWRSPGQQEWLITVLVSLYAEARSQQRLTGFSRTTRWVLDRAAARMDKAAVNAVPLKLLQGLYLALGPRQKGWALWSHPTTARRMLKAKGASR